MSLTRVAGNPDYTRAGSGFIPEVWSPRLIKKYYTLTCLTDITNTDYEGEIRNFGDLVWARNIPDITTFEYQKGMTLPTQRPEVDAVSIPINKGRGWNIVVDDVDRVQADIALLDKWTGDAAQQTKIAIDLAFFADSDIYDGANSYNKGATAGKISSGFNLGASGAPVQITKSNVTDYITDCGTVLDENDVPKEGRWMVLPHWVIGMLGKSDLKDASFTGQSLSWLLSGNGKFKQVGDFMIYGSNQISYYSTDLAYRCIFGTKDAITFATQYVKTESLRAESTFGDIVRGLQVYGYKVIKSQALGSLYIKK